MSNLVEHARRELRLAGYFNNGALGKAVLDLVEKFSEWGHSGMSAAITIQAFQKVASFEPLTPLTGNDDEWNELGGGYFQNKRCSHVFKTNGEAYDIEGIIWTDKKGCSFTNRESRVPVTFPYTPKREYREAPPE